MAKAFAHTPPLPQVRGLPGGQVPAVRRWRVFDVRPGGAPTHSVCVWQTASDWSHRLIPLAGLGAQCCAPPPATWAWALLRRSRARFLCLFVLVQHHCKGEHGLWVWMVQCWQGWGAVQCKAVVWGTVVWGLSPGCPTCSLYASKWQ